MALKQDFTIFSGNDVILEVTVTDEDLGVGIALNLTGALALIWALAKNSGAAALITKTLLAGVNVIDAVAGRVQITINATDTEALKDQFYHELRLTNAAGKKVTLMYGEVQILNNLIRN